MLKHFNAVLLLVLSCNVAAMPELTTVGQGTYRYLFWQIYDARLATADGTFSNYQQSTPLLLELTYKRDISVQQFVDSTVDEWQKLGHISAEQQASWARLLLNIWQDVKQGDTLAALLQPSGSVLFYHNGKEGGAIDDQRFGPAFFDIWLHPNTSAPDLRRKLIAAR
ncbi:MAG: chalcone isomerase family protein [Rheinheimera sp.]|nr:chalcone isomerase family protein [Rheinheimera sp.]